jgi:adenosylcobyric acid synthase
MITATHGGNQRRLAALAKRPVTELLDFSANINPMGPPEWLRPLIASQITALTHYPDPDCTELIAAASVRYGIPEDELIAANGTEELLYLLPPVTGKARALVPVPSYVDYARTAAAAGMQVVSMPLAESSGFALDCGELERQLRGDEVVYLGHPNNPTGASLDAAALRRLIERNPATFFVIDEAFADFVDGIERFCGQRQPNVLVLLSLTKLFAVPGLRVGCAAANPAVVRALRARLPLWNVNSLAQAVGAAALRDNAYVVATRGFVRQQRDLLAARLAALPGLYPFPGEANFLLVRLDRASPTAPDLATQLLARGIAIRTCGDFDGLGARFFRVAVRTAEENLRLTDSLADILGAGGVRQTAARRAATIMFQGTSSNAGKSVLTAALCRILHQDGLRVAPYKSQNMSLNSFVTRDGLEMGRAQVVQAQACRIEPEARMNPILLKPNSDTGSQVVLLGKPVGNMHVGDYIKFKPQAFEVAKRAFDSLSAENDVVVLEGAGSPAEVNLKRHDIVNMAMARYANAPVLLVGDIDRGGVYASFVGTMEVMSEWERAMVAGFVVNRFRGQESLLADAHAYVLRHTGCPVVGVVPYLSKLGLPEEDSVTFKAEKSQAAMVAVGQVDVVLLDLPHVSNFTDIDALRIEPDVNLRIVRELEDLGRPDAVILPGSKHVVADLAHLRNSGLADAVMALAAAGHTEIIGICGGYQMLGRMIEDPLRVESDGKPVAGLGLLDITTVMAAEKTLRRAECRHPASGSVVTGYEIHHGLSACADAMEPAVVRLDGEVIGTGCGQVWGSYLHGIFDADPFRRWFIDRLRVRAGMEPLDRVVAVYDIEAAFDRLAAVVRERLDMQRIYQLLKL